MQRVIFPILFLVVLAAPFAVRLAVLGDAEEARQGSDLPTRRLVIITPHNRDILLEFERAFSDWHARVHGERVEIAFVLPGGTNDIVKLLDKTYAGLRDAEGRLRSPDEIDAQTQYDMVWGGGDFTFNSEMEPRGVLQAIELPDGVLRDAFPEPALAGIALYDQDDADPTTPDTPGVSWVGVCLSSFGIVYSPFYYERISRASGQPLPLPETWQDLARPELEDRVALADPGSSGSAAVAYMMVLQRAMGDAEARYLQGSASQPSSRPAADPDYHAAIEAGWKQGMGDLLLIAANARYFADSASRVPADVSSASAAAGLAIDFYGRVEQELAGEDRIGFVSPQGATAVTADPIAVLHRTAGQRLETATRFIEFLLSREGQLLWILEPGAPGGPSQRALRRPPIRRDVYADRSGWTDDVNPFEEAGGFNQRQEWMLEFTETRIVWQAAWIESQTALQEAYHAVLSVSDPARREALLAELRDLPITWDDVRAMRRERRAQPKARESAWIGRERVRLANRFRAHYRAIQSAAEEEA